MTFGSIRVLRLRGCGWRATRQTFAQSRRRTLTAFFGAFGETSGHRAVNIFFVISCFIVKRTNNELNVGAFAKRWAARPLPLIVLLALVTPPQAPSLRPPADLILLVWIGICILAAWRIHELFEKSIAAMLKRPPTIRPAT